MPPAKPPAKPTSNFHASEKAANAKVDKLAIDSMKPIGSARGQSSSRKVVGTSGGSTDSFRKDGKRPDSARKPAESSMKTKSATPRAATRKASIKPSKDAPKPLDRPSQKSAEAESSTEKKEDAAANGSTPRAAMASSTSKGGGMAAGTAAAAAKEKAEGKYPVRDDAAPSRHSIINSWSTQNDPVLLFNCSGAACRFVISPSYDSYICMQVRGTVYTRLFPSRWPRMSVSAGGAHSLTATG